MSPARRPLLALLVLLAVLAGSTSAAAAPASRAAEVTVPAVALPEPPRWAPPLPGPPAVVRGFDEASGPYGPGHRGVDLAGAPGGAVLAAGDGVVVYAGLVAGRSVVSVQHSDGLRTTYEPVQPRVAAGEPVARGSPLGLLLPGHPGCPVDACLHWGLRRDESYLDPLLLLHPPRVRLLPWAQP